MDQLLFLFPLIRYCRIPGAKPLWPVSSGRPSKADIPKCSYCAGPLCFEFQVLDHECDLDNFLLRLNPNLKFLHFNLFYAHSCHFLSSRFFDHMYFVWLQIMPQLLFYFNVKNDVDSLDWATIAVYTCEASCDASVAYKEEFAWVQLS